MGTSRSPVRSATTSVLPTVASLPVASRVPGSAQQRFRTSGRARSSRPGLRRRGWRAGGRRASVWSGRPTSLRPTCWRPAGCRWRSSSAERGSGRTAPVVPAPLVVRVPAGQATLVAVGPRRGVAAMDGPFGLRKHRSSYTNGCPCGCLLPAKTIGAPSAQSRWAVERRAAHLAPAIGSPSRSVHRSTTTGAPLSCEPPDVIAGGMARWTLRRRQRSRPPRDVVRR